MASYLRNDVLVFLKYYKVKLKARAFLSLSFLLYNFATSCNILLHLNKRARSISMKKFLSLFIILTFVTAKMQFTSVNAYEIITIRPQTSDEVIVNPGKGWIVYHDLQYEPNSVLNYTNTGYRRYNWYQIEPNEGYFNWDIIDADIEAWASKGKKFAFGVANANTSLSSIPYITPKWVFDAGADYKIIKSSNNLNDSSNWQCVPVWDDPIFLQKVQNFVNAFAARYNNNPNIAFIDARSYGNYGENHVWGLENPLTGKSFTTTTLSPS